MVKATEVTAGLAESNGSLLPGLWRDSLHVTCGLTACTPGSAPGRTLGNEYGKTLPLPYIACGSTWRRHTGKHGSSAPHQRITQQTSWPHVASPTRSSTEQVARPATKRFHTSDWRALETCGRPWTWWCNHSTALAGYATMMMMIARFVQSCSRLLVGSQQYVM